jgi:murein L,D-transpeptidase YcbB/YkuD
MRNTTYALCLSFFLLSGCDRVQALADQAAAAQITPEGRKELGTTVEKAAADIVTEAFEDPEAKKRVDAAFEKIFSGPEAEGGIDKLMEACMAEPAVQSEIASLGEDAVKDPAVAKKLQELIAGASTPGEIEARIEKHTTAAFESPAVTKAIETAVEKIIEAPDVDARITAIFAKADIPPGFMNDDLLKAEKSFEAAFAKAEAEGKRSQFMADWVAAAKKDPAAKKAAAALVTDWAAAIETSPELKAVIKGGLESPRTKRIVSQAMADVLAEPEVKASARDLFKAVMVGAENQELLAQKTTALFEHPKVQSRMRKAVLELLESPTGTEKLKSAILSGLQSPKAKERLQEVVTALLSVRAP